jgi:hypothetical protein
MMLRFIKHVGRRHINHTILKATVINIRVLNFDICQSFVIAILDSLDLAVKGFSNILVTENYIVVIFDVY